MRKLLFLLTFCAGFVSSQAQTFTSGLTTTGTGAAANTRLGGTNPLLVNTTIDLGTFNFGLKTTAQPNIFNVLNNGNIGFGVPSPLSFLHIKAGTATAAPLIFTSGLNLTTPVAGALEFDATGLNFSPAAGTRKVLAYSDLSNVTAVIPIAKGGTGAATLATGYVKSNGTALSTVTTITGADVSGNITGYAANVTGVVPVANGGSGAVTNTGVLFGNGTLAFTSLAATGGNQYLRRNAGNTAYEFATITGGTGTVTSVGLNVPTGFTVTPATITTNGTFAIATTLNGLLRGNGTGFTTGLANLATEVTGILPIANGGTGATTSATALTALLPIQSAGTSGQVLRSNGTIASWSTVSGTGTVSSLSVLTANGFTGTIANNTTTPVITLSTNVTGLLKGNGTAISAATAGTDYLVPNGSAANLTGFPTLNQNTTGTAATITGSIAQSQVTNLVADLAAKQGALTLTTTSSSGPATLIGNTLNIPNYANGIASTAWSLQGNAATNPLSNFIGTTDAVDLLIKTNGQQVAKFSGNSTYKTSLGIKDNQALGNYSLATGEASIATGNGSFSANYHTSAEADYSTSLGYQSKAQGFASLALGSSTAIGQNSLSSGIGYAYGKSSVALGDRPLAKSFSEIAVGMNSTNYTAASTTAFSATDRLFVVGNGVDFLNPSDALVMLKNGNTGLGTSNPTKKLHVYGTNPSVFIEGDANSFFPELRIKSQVGQGYIDNYGPAGYSYGMFLNTVSAQNEKVGVGASTTGGVAFTNDPSLVSFRVISTPNQTNDIFKVIKNSATTPGFFTEKNALVVNKDGKVLIGEMTGINVNSTNFDEFKLAVNGSAIFTKAVVRLTTTWPDYVFEPTNKLPTLAEVEAYIAKHKHLQDVPSAEEVKEKGIDLGDNQTILLKKVEELTLYMIELNKKVETLAKENEALKKKVNGDK